MIIRTMPLQGCFYESGVLFVGVRIIRALMFGVYIRARLICGNSQLCEESSPSLQAVSIHALERTTRAISKSPQNTCI